MEPVSFPQANTVFGPPQGMTEEQVRSIPAFKGQIVGGIADGSSLVIVAWKPSLEDLQNLLQGEAIYICMVGGLCPHYLTTSFESCVNITVQ